MEMTERSSTVALVGAVAHQRLVDLDRVEGEAGEVGERGMARAEIVEREAEADILQLVEDEARLFRILHHDGFGEFQLQLLRLAAVRARAARTSL
jgi:hypothetical protein